MPDTFKIEAQDVSEGDMLLDLDNGYVYEDAVVGDLYYDNVDINFHDAEGNECTLSVPADFMLRVSHYG